MGSGWWNLKRNDNVKELMKNPAKFFQSKASVNIKHVNELIDEYYNQLLKQRKQQNNADKSSSDFQANRELEPITYEDLNIGTHFMFKELFSKNGKRSKDIRKLLSRQKKWDIMAKVDTQKNAYDFK